MLLHVAGWLVAGKTAASWEHVQVALHQLLQAVKLFLSDRTEGRVHWESTGQAG